MKVGNQVGGMTVIDVKRVNKMNIIQFTKAVSEYIDQGYKIDVNSARAIGLVLQVDMYKLESNVSVDSTEDGKSFNKEDLVLTVNGVEADVLGEHEIKTEITIGSDEDRLSELDKSVEDAKEALNTFTTPEQNDATVKKQTRAKKTT